MSQSREGRDRPGHVYVVAFADGTIKIGATTTDPPWRRVQVVSRQAERARRTVCTHQWVSAQHPYPWELEARALDYADKAGQRTWDRETFTGLDLARLKRWIKKNSRLIDN